MNETVNIVNSLLGLPTNKFIFKKFLVESDNVFYEKDKINNCMSP
jgi:hypothetical protein